MQIQFYDSFTLYQYHKMLIRKLKQKTFRTQLSNWNLHDLELIQFKYNFRGHCLCSGSSRFVILSILNRLGWNFDIYSHSQCLAWKYGPSREGEQLEGHNCDPHAHRGSCLLCATGIRSYLPLQVDVYGWKCSSSCCWWKGRYDSYLFAWNSVAFPSWPNSNRCSIDSIRSNWPAWLRQFRHFSRLRKISFA